MPTIVEIADVFNGKTPSKAEQRNEGLPILKIRDIDENGKFTGVFGSYVDAAFNKKYSNKKLHAGDTIILNAAHSADYVGNKSALVSEELDGTIATGEWLIVRPKTAYSSFVNHFLKSPEGRQKIKKEIKGIHLYPKDVERIQIPLPSPDDQIRIATLLSRLEALIATRKDNLRLLDEFLKSAFLEMFGPSNQEFESWPLTEIKELAANHKGAMRTGPFGSNLLHNEFTESGDVAVLGIDNAVQNTFAWGTKRYITKEKYEELKNYRIFPGDVIITIMGTIGRSAVVPDDIPLAINTKHLAAITLDTRKANPIFISYSIHSSPYIINQLASKNRGAIMNGLNLGLIKETKLRKPPIDLQNNFGTIVKKVEHLKSLYQQNLSELENLYGVLSQKAFKGELDLSRIPLEKQDSVYSVSSVVDTEKKELTATANYAMSDPATREKLLRQLFDVFVAERKGTTFSFEDFWTQAEMKVIDHMDEESLPLGVADYDKAKEWLFDMLKSGYANQRFNEEKNRMELSIRK